MATATTYGFRTAIEDGYPRVTGEMLSEQMAKIDRIDKEKELLKHLAGCDTVTAEQVARFKLLVQMLSIENVYLRIMQQQLFGAGACRVSF